MKPIELVYEIRLDNKVVPVEMDIWMRLRNKIRENSWFYLLYHGKKYKYKKDREFFDRPVIFCFDSVKENEEDEIEIMILE